MSLGVFLAVLGAAFLHAAWNGLIRTGSPGQSRLQNLLVMALVQGAGRPQLQPVSAIDYVSGYLMAFGAITALLPSDY